MEIFDTDNSSVTPTVDQQESIRKANRWIYEATPVVHPGLGNTINVVYNIDFDPDFRLILGPFGEFVELQKWNSEESPENPHCDWEGISESQLGEDIMDAILYD